MEMIRTTVEVHEGSVTYRVRITASCTERALEIARQGKPGRRVRTVFPIDPYAFFAPEGSISEEAA